MKKSRELPVVLFKSARAWERWLGINHTKSPGVWLRFAKKDSGLASVSYAEALDAALRHGWIDSQKKSYDQKTWLQRFTPRGPKSIWSRLNREKVRAFRKAGLMTPLGLQAVEAAQKSGRWGAAYPSQAKIQIPPDLAAALKKNPGAKAFFSALSSADRYALLFRIHPLKKGAARAAKIAAYVDQLEKKRKIGRSSD